MYNYIKIDTPELQKRGLVPMRRSKIRNKSHIVLTEERGVRVQSQKAQKD